MRVSLAHVSGAGSHKWNSGKAQGYQNRFTLIKQILMIFCVPDPVSACGNRHADARALGEKMRAQWQRLKQAR
ncbi:hypothetical protein [Paraburkholderia pallida]|uniref:Uncharacterized protein n=1 Tax=Paraburkholderia pallida TaxID=2547399 RepID=A0A4P7D1N3_9BURK|nr:hypothetical protein [Paraburkholderia pallida]QBR01778.1 hypothetical protein E1956_32015 [Paraburkholderia pallida]